MAGRVNRRRFLADAAAGTAVGAAATVAAAARAARGAELPLPDAGTKATADGSGPEEACCTPAARLIFACSGSADVGKIADLSAREMADQGVGKMFCLAGVGGRVEGIMKTTAAAEAILAVDGCPLQCARNTLQKAGFKQFEHVCLADLGMEKGKTPATQDRVDEVVACGRKRLAKQE